MHLTPTRFHGLRGILIPAFIASLAVNPHARPWVVDNTAAGAADNNSGTAASPFLTISKGAEMAQPGDTVLVHAGIYRERVAPPRGGTSESMRITYLAAPGDSVFIKGSDVWEPDWIPHPDTADVYTAGLEGVAFGSYNPYHILMAGVSGMIGHTPTDRLILGQIFVNGKMLTETHRRDSVLLRPGYWKHDSTTDMITVHFPTGTSPSGSLVELSVRQRIFAPHPRGLGYITVKGFIMEHCANQYPGDFWAVEANAQAGALGTRSGNHWIIENNVIRWAKNIGLDCGSESERNLDVEGTGLARPTNVGYHIIRRNVICDNGAAGVMGITTNSVKFLYNVIERNVLTRIGYEGGGIKMHGFTNGVIEGNLIRNNFCDGIWLDAGFRTSRVSRNIFIRNYGHGLMLELDGGGPCMVDNNIVAFQAQSSWSGTPGGPGIHGQDANNISVVHDLVFRSSTFGIYGVSNTGRTGTTTFTNWKAQNNIVLRSIASDISFGNLTFTLADLEGNVLTPFKFVPANMGTTQNDTSAMVRTFDTTNMVIELDVRQKYFDIVCPKIATVTTDFLGNPMPATVHPGPFQNLVLGINRIALSMDSLPQSAWPVGVSPDRGVVRADAVRRGPTSPRTVIVGSDAHRGIGATNVEYYSISGRRMMPDAGTESLTNKQRPASGVLIVRTVEEGKH